MCPLHEAKGEVKDGGRMTQAGPKWRRCRIKKLGGEEDHISTQACSSQGGNVPHWLHLWPIKQLGLVGEAKKRGAGFRRGARLIFAGRNCHSGGLYCTRGHQGWVGVKHSVHFYKTHIRMGDSTWASHVMMTRDRHRV